MGGRREVFLARARRWEGLTKFVRSGHGGGKIARSFFGPDTAVVRPHEVCAEVPFRGPAGDPGGPPGPQGPQGNDGPPGAQGAPGEVMNTQLTTAINGTSSNSNAVLTLDTPFADPDAEALRLRFNELVLALRRS